jgi:hypothetical protein
MHVQVEQAAKRRFLYAHEVSVGSLPGLADRVHVPKYFINDYHELTVQPGITPSDLMKKVHYPVAFIGPPGSTTPLHTDGVQLLFLLHNALATSHGLQLPLQYRCCKAAILFHV